MHVDSAQIYSFKLGTGVFPCHIQLYITQNTINKRLYTEGRPSCNQKVDVRVRLDNGFMPYATFHIQQSKQK